MKKSDAIKLLDSKLILPEDLASYILDILILDAGFKPPSYTKETTFDDLTLFTTVEGWEPED